MTIVAQLFEHVVGIDTHARTHTYCLITASAGRTGFEPVTSSVSGNSGVSVIVRLSRARSL